MLLKLGQILGKDTTALTSRQQVDYQIDPLLFDALQKENEVLRLELSRERRDSEVSRRSVEVTNIKCELLFQEMVR